MCEERQEKQTWRMEGEECVRRAATNNRENASCCGALRSGRGIDHTRAGTRRVVARRSTDGFSPGSAVSITRAILASAPVANERKRYQDYSDAQPYGPCTYLIDREDAGYWNEGP